MYLRTVAIALLALASLPAADSTTLGLLIRDGSPVPPAVQRYLESETGRSINQFLRADHLRVIWRAEGASQPGESFDRLIVLRFQGDCSARMTPLPASGGPLGWTSTSDGRVQPFVTVDCGRVKSILAESGVWPHSMLPAAMLGRALSRVTAHELYHAITGRKHHDSDGLFKAGYSSSDLLAPSAELPGEQVDMAGVPTSR